ncbi:MAG TPA: hypothetical protein VNK48_14365 [Xanthobacteraceae bacterium]|nr:hypothetical protein [Xanthobacteraceae bacterium]
MTDPTQHGHLLGAVVHQLATIAKDIGAIQTSQAHLGAQMVRLEGKVDCLARKMRTSLPPSTPRWRDVLAGLMRALPWLKLTGIGILLLLGGAGYLSPEEVRASVLWLMGRL